MRKWKGIQEQRVLSLESLSEGGEMMAERRKLKRNRNLTSGSMALNVNGSAIPKRRYLPDEKREIVKKPKQINKKYAEMKYAPSIDVFGFVCLMMVAAVLVFICVGYVRVYNEIKQTENETRTLNVELSSIKTANDNTENTLYSNIDLGKIRKTAIEKYGMVYPYENQVITYKSVTNGYVRQYGDLKGNEELNFIERVLRLVDAG